MLNEGNNATDYLSSPERIEALRLILEKEQGRSVSYEEAADVGDSLISFFEVLADSTFEEQQALLEATA